MPAVTVIIPTRNSAAFIEDCLRSVAAQTVSDIEIVIVDSESTDETRVRAESSGVAFRWKTVPHRGPGAARNLGVEAATGEVIAFLDSDDQWLPGKLEKQLAALEQASAGAVYCRVFEKEAGKPLIPRKTGTPTGDVAEAILTDPTIITTSALAFRRYLWEKAGCFIETSPIGEDWEWFVRMACVTTFAAVPEPLVYYRLHSANTHRNLVQNWPHAQTVLEECLRSFRERKGKVDSDLERRVWFNLYQSYGTAHLFSGHSYDATPFFWNAWRQRPGELKTAAYLLASLLPPSLLSRIQRWRGRA